MIWRHRLEDLELEPEERVALQRQGFVSVEKRANGSSYFKLRFRCGGHQRVRGLGNNPAVAEQVRRQVQELQAKRRRVTVPSSAGGGIKRASSAWSGSTYVLAGIGCRGEVS